VKVSRFAATLCLAFLGACGGEQPSPRAIPDLPKDDRPPVVLWSEHFDHDPLGWVDFESHSAHLLAKIYSVEHESTLSFLHARHDAHASGAPPALHYGRAFRDDPIPLDRIRALRFRWRARTHPPVSDDPWLDLAAGIYVVIHTPSILGGGRGFKLGWLAKPGPSGTHQLGLLQVALRTDPAGPEWKSESVDLCALYRHEYGDCAGEKLLYVGVTTDGDGTKSVAEGDYADFEVVGVK
jgi:hypothetical protein